MCVVSMVMDNWFDKHQIKPNIRDYTFQPIFEQATKQDIEDLRKEIRDLKQLVIKAKKYDEEHDQPDCEMDQKVELIKSIAEELGVSFDDVFKRTSPA